MLLGAIWAEVFLKTQNMWEVHDAGAQFPYSQKNPSALEPADHNFYTMPMLS